MATHKENHPDPHLLGRFMRNEAGAPERRRVVRHLLAGCARCSALTRRLWSFGEEPTEEPEGPVDPAGAAVHSGISRARAMYEQCGDLANLARLRHLEAKLAEDRGALDEAEAGFLEARQGLLLHGLAREAAEVLLDLAILYLRTGRTAEVCRLTDELFPIFQARDIRQGEAFALLYVRRLAETGHATLEALSAVHGLIAGPHRRPALR
jgi:hypothetical protein